MEKEPARKAAEKLLGESASGLPLLQSVLRIDWLDDEYAIPNQDATARWIIGEAVCSVIADPEPLRLELSPVVGTELWGATATFEKAPPRDRLEKAFRVATHWKFTLADGKEVEVRSAFSVTSDTVSPDKEETFAYDLAKKMMAGASSAR